MKNNDKKQIIIFFSFAYYFVYVLSFYKDFRVFGVHHCHFVKYVNFLFKYSQKNFNTRRSFILIRLLFFSQYNLVNF